MKMNSFVFKVHQQKKSLLLKVTKTFPFFQVSLLNKHGGFYLTFNAILSKKGNVIITVSFHSSLYCIMSALNENMSTKLIYGFIDITIYIS